MAEWPENVVVLYVRVVVEFGVEVKVDALVAFSVTCHVACLVSAIPCSRRKKTHAARLSSRFVKQRYSGECDFQPGTLTEDKCISSCHV